MSKRRVRSTKADWFNLAAAVRPLPRTASEFGAWDYAEGLPSYPRVPSDDLCGYRMADETERGEYLAAYDLAAGHTPQVYSTTGDYCRGCGGEKRQTYGDYSYDCPMCAATGLQSIAPLPAPHNTARL